jgi:hypothetical protein
LNNLFRYCKKLRKLLKVKLERLVHYLGQPTGGDLIL